MFAFVYYRTWWKNGKWGLTFFNSSEWGWIIRARIHPHSSWFIHIRMNRRKLIPIHHHSPFIHHVLILYLKLYEKFVYMSFRLWQPEFPFLIRWTSKNLAALPKKKMQLDVDIEPTFRFTYMKCTNRKTSLWNSFIILRVISYNLLAQTDRQTESDA